MGVLDLLGGGRWRRERVLRYLDALRGADLQAMDALFLADAVVRSPIWGERDAASFYRQLFASTRRSEIELLDVYRSTLRPGEIAARFRYDWTLRDGSEVGFECVDVFRFADSGQRFAALTIIYDSRAAAARVDALAADDAGLASR